MLDYMIYIYTKNQIEILQKKETESDIQNRDMHFLFVELEVDVSRFRFGFYRKVGKSVLIQ